MKLYLVKLVARDFTVAHVRVRAWTGEEAKTEARNITGQWDWLKVVVIGCGRGKKRVAA